MKETLKLRLPKVRITESAWKLLRAFIQACPKEVGGIGTVTAEEDELIVREVFLIGQEASAGDFEIDPQALGQFLNEWIRQGRDTSELKFWWHSHADMNTFWSAVDEDTMQRLAGDSYLVSLVGNRKGEHRTCLTLMHPLHITVDDIRIDVIEELHPELVEWAEAEVQDKVRIRRKWLGKKSGKADRSEFCDAEQVGPGQGFFTRWRNT